MHVKKLVDIIAIKVNSPCKRLKLRFFIGTNFKTCFHGNIFMNKNFPDENNCSKMKASKKFKNILPALYRKRISRN